MNQSIVILLCLSAVVAYGQPVDKDNAQCVEDLQKFVGSLEISQQVIDAIATIKGQQAREPAISLEAACEQLAPTLKQVREANPCMVGVNFHTDPSLNAVLHSDEKLETVAVGSVVCGYFGFN